MRPVTLAADSDVYMPITAGVGITDDGHRCWITRWRLTDEDKAQHIASGEDVFLFITGHARDKPDVLRSAAVYIETHRAKP